MLFLRYNTFCYSFFSLEITGVGVASMCDFSLAESHHRLGCALALSHQLIKLRQDQSLHGGLPGRNWGARGTSSEVCETGFLPLSQR